MVDLIVKIYYEHKFILKCSQALLPRQPSVHGRPPLLGPQVPFSVGIWLPETRPPPLFLHHSYPRLPPPFLLWRIESTSGKGKAYDLTMSKSATEICYYWVESSKHYMIYMRSMVPSRGALLWLCKKLWEASEDRTKREKLYILEVQRCFLLNLLLSQIQ